jgi:hypothetical protein
LQPLETRPPVTFNTNGHNGKPDQRLVEVESFLNDFLRRQQERAAKNCRLGNLERDGLLEQMAQKISDMFLTWPRCSAGENDQPCDNCKRDYEIANEVCHVIRALKIDHGH